MQEDSIRVLSVVQEVLRGFVLATAATNRQAVGEFGSLLAAAGENDQIDPIARKMLQDLAEGALMLSTAGQSKQ